MRYSEVLSGFYRIHLAPDQADIVDVLYTLAAHHLRRTEEAQALGESRLIDFHFRRHRRAYREMLREVFENAAFSDAVAPDGTDLNDRNRWNPKGACNNPLGLEIFDEMIADWRFPMGRPHCNDTFLWIEDEILAAA